MAANGRRYGFSGSITGAASKTAVGLVAPSTPSTRLFVADLVVSSNATPADNSSEWQVLRSTAAGTSTSVTPAAFDEADGAALTTCGKNHTVEPTYTGVSLLDIAHNQRATFRWVAAPSEELLGAATAAHGFGVQCQGVGGSGVAEIVSIVFGE